MQRGRQTVQLADILHLGGPAVVHTGRHSGRLLTLLAVAALLVIGSFGAMLWWDVLAEPSALTESMEDTIRMAIPFVFLLSATLFVGAFFLMRRGGYDATALVTITEGGIVITDSRRQITYAQISRDDIAEIRLTGAVGWGLPADSSLVVRTVSGERTIVDFTPRRRDWRGWGRRR